MDSVVPESHPPPLSTLLCCLLPINLLQIAIFHWRFSVLTLLLLHMPKLRAPFLLCLGGLHYLDTRQSVHGVQAS